MLYCKNYLSLFIRKTGWLSLLVLLLSTAAYSQRVEFTRDNDEEFLEQLNYLTNGLERQARNEAQLVIDSFSVLWQSEFMTTVKKEMVFETLDAMQNLRLRPWPEQAVYFQSVIGVAKTENAAINFEAWHQSFQSLLTLQTQRRLTRHWELGVLLFRENVIYASNVVKWVLRHNNYSLSFDDGQALIIIEPGDLVCYAQDDSTVIYNTRGQMHMAEEKFIGRGGRITWERAGLDPGVVYADLAHFEINLPAARWQADSVTFSNRNYFQQPIMGRLTERIIAEVNNETTRYPRFESYQAVHEINNLFEGINYKGGFTMTGGRVLGSSTRDGDAEISFYRSDSLFITARSRSFSIHQDRIVTQRAAVSIYLSGDSIYHPNVNMRYLDKSREFSLLRDDKGYSKAPFSNSFHRLDMYCEAIYWNIDTYDVEMRMIRSISETGQAVFESQDFFSHMRYMRMQGMSQLHPLIRLRNFAREYNSNTFPIQEYARYIRGDVASVRSQMITFSQHGFVAFNQDDETVTLGDKVFHYIASYAGRSDFDVIQIHSEAPVNARLNMNNFDLHLFGVERIPLSDQKNVVLHPTNREIIMKKNRDIYFDGRIESGLFDFYGQEFFFDYDMFKIDLLQTDSMSFRVRSFEPDSRGRYSEVRVKTVLEGINGELLVDHPRNKSGQMPYPRFPIFNSNNESFVYYDRDDVQEGVYRREDVYFRLIPFSIDSLDNATTDNIAFDGVFISTGIFPDFYDYLTVQPDYSLGFNTQTPEDGYTVYGGKAVYKGPIDMSYEGLRADGQLEYLNATIHANTMLMFPDSARAHINTFNLAAQDLPVEYPDVKARDVNMLFLPHQDDMNIASTTRPIEIFEGLASLKGSIGLTPEGLSGKGSLEFFGGQMLSDNFDFKFNDFQSERSDLTLLASDGQSPAVKVLNYSSEVSIADRKAELRTIEDGDSKLDFVMNRFNGFGFDMDWDMEEGRLQLSNTLSSEIAQLGELAPEDWIDYNFSGHELVSTHTAQDGLSFYAGTAEYNLADNVIDASGVKIIKVADAAIYPYQEKVQILERAEISRLENSSVIANTTTLLHRFYDADLSITSRWNYSGSGLYDYEDVAGNIQTIQFESIAVDRAYRTTIARAEIEEEQDFNISPRFAYKGAVDLKAENPNFFYNGATRMFVDCPLYNPNWFRFEAEIQKDQIFIPIAEDLRNDANGRIQTSMMLAGDSVHIYPAVFDRQKHYSDLAMINTTGYLTYNNDLRQYQISTMEKLRDLTLPDNIISINPHTCIVEGHGDITLSEGLGQFTMVNYGRITHDLHQNELELDIVMGLDFFFLNQALGMVESNIRESEHTDSLNINRFKYVSFLQKKTNRETSQRLIAEFLEDGAFRRFPPELNHGFFFADLRMKWDQATQTFHTTRPLGLGNMERFPINMYVDGFIELRKQRGNDVFNMILMPGGLPDEGLGLNWFFFTYSGGIMQTIASSNDYNDMIRNVNPRRRRMDVERGEEPFTYMLSSDRRPIDFVRSMRLLNRAGL